MAIDFNVAPFYDDFNEKGSDGLAPSDKYHRILFRPGHAVQARELTQLQSILQNQITQFGRHFFEEGSMVIPGQSTVEVAADLVKIDTIVNGDVTDLKGLKFTAASGLEFRVTAAVEETDDDPITIYVKYLNSADSLEQVVQDSEVCTSGDISFTAVNADATGQGSIVHLDPGVYFTEGTFVAVQESTIILEKYDTSPSYDVGLDITETVQTIANDVNLGDTALGTPNEAAAGAHRYEIKSELVKRTIGDDSGLNKFILLARIKDGVVQRQVRETDYSVLEETLARRTFDESGNYSVRPFMISIREHTDVNDPGDQRKLTCVVEPSKAYVRGYEIETLSSTNVDVRKARDPKDTDFFEDSFTNINIGNYVEVENVYGVPDIATFGLIEIWNKVLLPDGNVDTSGDNIGYCRARSVDYRGNGLYRVYLFDIQMNDVNSDGIYEDFSTAKSFSGTGNLIAFRGDINLVNVSTVSGSTVEIARRYNVTNNKLVFPLQFQRVQTLDSAAIGEDPDFNISYDCIQDVGEDEVAGGILRFVCEAGATFNNYDSRDWILVYTSGVNIGARFDLDALLQSNGNAISYAANEVTIDMGGVTGKFALIASVRKPLLNKVKSLGTSEDQNVSFENYGAGGTSLPDKIFLEESDGFRLLNVYMSDSWTTPATSANTDVTQYYTFNSGQTDNFYGPSFIQRRTNTGFVPSGQILVVYEYFTWEGEGDFLSVDSYVNRPDASGNVTAKIVSPVDGYEVKYEDIPSYTTNSGESIELRSAVDFRPRVDNNSFDSNLSNIPKPGSTFETDVRYYLNRIDSLFIDKNGKFGVIEGVPAVSPEIPQQPKDAMVLYNLFIPGYTLNPQEVEVEMIDNKRYTMRDIGKLEKRINNLEYYTTLSLLEKDAATKDISDTTFGQRAKAGFIVDSFTTHNTGNVSSQEYKAAIDRDRHALRPSFYEDNARLVFDSNLSETQQTGALITLPYTETSLEFQNKASDSINVNPYDVFEWTGSLEISPTSDEWVDTNKRPDVIVDQEGVYDAMLGIIEETDALGTVWNNWQTNWTGVSSTSTSTGVSRRTGSWWRRRTQSGTETTTTTVTTQGQSRTGIETFVVPDTITTNLGDRVVEMNFAPFIRSRIVHFKGTRLKPNTRVHAFFDGVNVDQFVREDPFYSYDDPQVVNNPVLSGQNEYTEHPVGGGQLVTDALGEVTGSFFIPNNSSVSFSTGTRIFKLCDSSTNDNNNITTQAEAAYNAKGLLQTKENVTLSTRVPLIERREVSDNRIVSNTRVTSAVTWHDPLAQSFMISESGGAFLTSIEIFFKTKSETIPVTLQIREMQNGIPTQVVVPFSEVTVNPAQVNVEDPTGDPDPTLPTKFTFSSPVFLQDNMEYCFVLLANTTEYNVYYGEIGGTDITSGLRISKQPYNGVLFKSQNASTWTPDQNKDLKFRMNRALFNISNPNHPDDVFTTTFKNAPVPAHIMKNDPFYTTQGSGTVRVYHPNHGLFNDVGGQTSEVTFAMPGINGQPDTSISIPVNGLELSGTHTVHDVDIEGYSITVTDLATATGVGGGIGVTGSRNMRFDTFFPFVQQLVLPGTNITYGVRTTTAGSPLFSIRPYQTTTTYAPVIANENSDMSFPGCIASADNMAGSSFFMQGYMKSDVDNLSPVIDTERVSIFTVANKINNPQGVGGINHTNSEPMYNFVPETAPTGGSAAAKYVTKTVQLASGATGIRVFVDVSRTSGTFVDLYYKVASDQAEIENAQWVLATTEDGEQVPFNDEIGFSEVSYDIDPVDAGGLPVEFSAFTIKIVMSSTNTSRVPLCRDLRIIAVD